MKITPQQVADELVVKSDAIEPHDDCIGRKPLLRQPFRKFRLRIALLNRFLRRNARNHQSLRTWNSIII